MKYDTVFIIFQQWPEVAPDPAFSSHPGFSARLSAVLILSLSLSPALQRGFPTQAFPHSVISPLLLIQRDQDWAFNPIQDGCLELLAHSPFPASLAAAAVSADTRVILLKNV